MFSDELKNLLLRVLTSWQVIVVTAALVLYLLLVLYVAQTKRVRRPAAYANTGDKKKARVKPEKKKASDSKAENEVTEEDDLGPEEHK